MDGRRFWARCLAWDPRAASFYLASVQDEHGPDVEVRSRGGPGTLFELTHRWDGWAIGRSARKGSTLAGLGIDRWAGKRSAAS